MNLRTAACLRAALIAVAIAAISAIAIPESAWAHAQLLGSSPARGETLSSAPEAIELEFNEPVEVSFGGVRLYDSSGNEIETGELERSERPEVVAIQPPAELADGAYTVTFRVVSADSHPVSGGFIFSVGEQEAPTLTVAELLEGEGDAGPVTDVAFASSRVLAYAALAAMLGGLAFLLMVWRPLRNDGDSDVTFLVSIRRLLIGGGLALAASAAFGIVCQGSLAAGISLFEALNPDVLGDVLETRYGETILIRGLLGLAFAALTSFAWQKRTFPAIPATAVLGLMAAAAAITLGLGGHAGAASPSWLMITASLGHVLAMASWFGGLAILSWFVPRLTREASMARRTVILAGLIRRFSALAIAAVAVLLLSGVVQSVVHLAEVSELWQSGFGRAILIKAVLFSGLIALGWLNRQRLGPRLETAAASGEPPGSAGRALRAALRAEVFLAVAVLAVSSVLVSLAPASSMDAIFTDATSAGPIEIEIVFEPPRVGTQETHIYLFDGATGEQWDEIEDIRLTATEPEQDIGPVPIELQRAGPGHYLNGGSLIAVPGEWTLNLDIRVSEFDAYDASFELRIR